MKIYAFFKEIHLILRDGAGEVDGCQLRVRGHGFAEDGTVGGEEVDHAVREPGVAEDLVDQVVGDDSGVAGLPQGYIAL